jgi:hypothetical protein
MSTPIQLNHTNTTEALTNSLDKSQKKLYNTLLETTRSLQEAKSAFITSLTPEQRILKRSVDVAKKALDNETRVETLNTKSSKKRKQA